MGRFTRRDFLTASAIGLTALPLGIDRVFARQGSDAVFRHGVASGDPLRDRGPFSELAVTGRQISAATMFSDDYLAIDGRLDRIRLRVELALPPRATTDPAI